MPTAVIAGIVCMAIGLILGRMRIKICIRAICRLFRMTRKNPSSYEISENMAVTYLIEIEKQEIEMRLNGFKHIAAINLAVLALSGGLLVNSKSTLLLLLVASLFYIISLIIILIAMSRFADQRKKRLQEVLKAIKLNTNQKVQIPCHRIASPTSSRILIFVAYALFIMGALFTINSFMIPSSCRDDTQNWKIQKFVCELVTTSEYISKDRQEKMQYKTHEQ